MRKIIFIAVSFVFLQCSNVLAAEVDSLINIISDSNKAFDERAVAEKELTSMNAMDVIPVLAKRLPNPPAGAIWNSAGLKRDKKASFEWQAFSSLNRIWAKHLSGKYSQEKGKILLQLATNNKDLIYKPTFLGYIYHHKTPLTYSFFVNIISDKNIQVNKRLEVIRYLLNADVNKYFSYGLDIIEKMDPIKQKNIYSHFLNIGNKRDNLSKKIQMKAAVLGCKIIKKNPAKSQYFNVRSIGFLLGIKNEFAPDQNLPKYKSEHGLNDEFFLDTVRKALIWCSKFF